MNYRRLGRTELEVSELGFGAWEIGWTPVEQSDEFGALLNRALDLGINFIDSSAAYRWSEEIIARHIGHRRDEFVFATKCGSWRVQQPDGEWVQTLDYSARAIEPQIDRSLQRLGTECIDIVQLHSPSYEDVAHGDGLEGLKKAQKAGKIRFVSISADGPTAEKAIEIGEFDTLQLTYNILQQDPKAIIQAAREKDMGIIIKNPIANAIYRKSRPEEGSPELWDRAQVLLSDEVTGGAAQVDTALRWLLGDEDVHTAIVGTTDLQHLEENVRAAEAGPLPGETVARVSKMVQDL